MCGKTGVICYGIGNAVFAVNVSFKMYENVFYAQYKNFFKPSVIILPYFHSYALFHRRILLLVYGVFFV